jgi:glycosyltransferase involved in cell wall biosynthesis
MTTYNEEKSIEKVIESIAAQSEKPDEVVLVDSNSKDQTINKAKVLFKKFNLKNKIIVKKCDRGMGRNIAIDNATNEYILGSDAGSILDKNWVKEMKKALKEHNFVLGSFRPTHTNFFEECVSIVTYPNIEEDKKLTNASSRSIGFTKTLWEKAGKYPEGNTSAEDTEFNFRMKDAGAKIGEAKKAIVYWKVRSTMKSFFGMYYSYGKGDRQNIKRVWHYLLFALVFLTYHLVLIISLFLNQIIFAILFAGLFAYCVRYGFLAINKTKRAKALYYGAILFYLKRLSYSLGIIFGV